MLGRGGAARANLVPSLPHAVQEFRIRIGQKRITPVPAPWSHCQHSSSRTGSRPHDADSSFKIPGDQAHAKACAARKTKPAHACGVFRRQVAEMRQEVARQLRGLEEVRRRRGPRGLARGDPPRRISFLLLPPRGHSSAEAPEVLPPPGAFMLLLPRGHNTFGALALECRHSYSTTIPSVV